MAGTKSIAKSRGRILKTITPAMAKAMKGLQEIKTGHSELLDSYDALEEKYELDKKNKTLAQKREELVKTIEDQKLDEEREKKQREKDIGASKQTVQTLKCMAADAYDFIRLCDLWNRGDPGVKKSKRVFEELEEAERLEWDATMTEAWTNRPLNCHNLRSALLHYSRQFVDLRRTNGAQFLVQGAKKVVKFNPDNLDILEIPDKPQADDAPTVSVMTKLECITRAIKKIDDAKGASQRDVFFPNCYRFCQQQTATSELRQTEFHRGGKMPLEEMYEKFPVLRPLPRSKVAAPDVDPSAPTSTRPASPSLVDYKKLEAAEAEVMRLKIMNDHYDAEEDEEEDEDGGYEGEQGDVFRQVFGDDSECDEGPREEGGETPTQPMEEEPSEPSEATGGESDAGSAAGGESDRESDRESESSGWRHDDEEMMFAEAMAAREA